MARSKSKTTRMFNLIINADDLLLSAGINDAIIELLDLGAVTNTTAMMCCEESPDTLTAIRRHLPMDRVGVHLQLTSGTPISTSQGLIDNQSGRFLNSDHFGSLDPAEVYLEWKAQVDLFIKIGGHPPSHLDSHHAPHRHKQLFPVYARLAKEYCVPVRAGGSISSELRTMSIRHPSGYVDDWTGASLSYGALLLSLDKIGSQHHGAWVEVVTHPSKFDSNLSKISSLSHQRYNDYTEIKRFFEFYSKHPKSKFSFSSFGDIE